MRISTGQVNTMALTAILDQQARLSQTQLQLAAGKKNLTPADDPVAASKSIGLDQSVSKLQQYQRNMDMAESRLQLEDSTLSDMTVVLNRIREIALVGNNSSLTPEDRSLLANEIKERQDELLSLANTRDSSGEYIYAGYQAQTQPFSQNSSGSYNYAGDSGQRFLQIGASRQIAVADSGNDVFMAIKNGNGTFTVTDNAANTGAGVIDPGSVFNATAYDGDTYTLTFVSDTSYEIRDSSNNLEVSGTYVEGQQIAVNGIQTTIKGQPLSGDVFTLAPSTSKDVFTTVNDLATAFENSSSNAVSTAKLNNSVNRFLSDIDQAMESLINVRSKAGARLSTIDSQRQLNESQDIQLKKDLSELNDLDYAEAITQLNLQKVGLEAAQQSYLRIQGLSLFNYL